jgi:hypothetical protein
LITVKVEYPILNNDTVSFVWHSDKHLPFFKQESFFVKYEGMVIENHNIEVFWQIFLSTLIPIFDLSEETVKLIFPESIPSCLAETWINYHSARNVIIIPLSDITTIKANICDNNIQDKARVGLLYGGGKDSACAFSMFSEIYGIENMLLISYVAPHSRKFMVEDDIRRERLLLGPLRKELNAKVQKVITDIRAIMIDNDTAKNINLAMFMGPALPIIIHYNLSYITFSYEFDTFYTSLHYSGKKRIHFMRCRPEFCSYISERTKSLFGINCMITNPNFSFSNLGAFKILANRYPHMLWHLLMCEAIADSDEKWCYDCIKCARFALFSLNYWKGEDFIDISRVLTENSYIKNALSPNGVFEGQLCNVVAEIDPEYVAQKTTKEAYENFMTLREKFSYLKNPSINCFIAPAFDKLALPKPLGDKLRNIITTYCPVANEVEQAYLYDGALCVDFDFSLVCDIPNFFNTPSQHIYFEMIEKH